MGDSFRQPQTQAAGIPPGTFGQEQNPASSSMDVGSTKAAKLVNILQSGLQGALAGRAKSEETVAATGGRRSGGAGMGFEAGYTLPWQRAAQQNQLAQQQAQTNVLRSEAQNVNVPGMGQIPGWLAKALGPAGIKASSAQTVQGMKGDTAESIAEGNRASQEKIHRYVPVPNVGLYDTQTRSVVPQTAQGITITPEIAKDHNLPDEFIGKPMGLTQLAAIQRSDVFANVPQMTAQGPIIVNRKTAQATPVTGPNGQQYSPPALASPREVADVDNPGQTIITSGTGAMGKPGPSSASVQVPKRAAAAEVPTKIGDQKVAFTTMVQHADLLRSAIQALNNGDQQTLSSLKNRFKAEFGVSGPLTAQAIADAYGGEVTNVIAKGHITDAEMSKTGKTLNVNRQSPEQSLAVLDAYKALAQSKMNMLDQQKNAAVNKSQPGGGNKDVIEWHIENGKLVKGPKPN